MPTFVGSLVLGKCLGGAAIAGFEGLVVISIAGDQIIVTFAAPPPPSAFCSVWSSSSNPDLTGINVAVTAEPISLGDDEITSVTELRLSGRTPLRHDRPGTEWLFRSLVGFTNRTIHWDP